MNIEQILTFLQVYHLGSFQEAANQMYLPQPTISHRITQLEKNLGKTLLIRGKGKIRLTEEGKAFLPYAREIIGALDEGREAVNRVRTGSGKIAIGCINSFISTVLYNVLDTFTLNYPEVSLKIDTYASTKLVQLIKHRDIQLAITRYASNDSSLIYKTVYSEPMTLIVSSKHKLAKHNKVTLDNLLNEPLITYQKHTQYRTMLDNSINQYHKAYKPKYETNNLALIKHFIKENAGVHVSGKLYMKEELEKKELVSLEIEANPFPQSKVYIAYLEGDHSLEHLFIDHFINYMKENFESIENSISS